MNNQEKIQQAFLVSKQEKNIGYTKGKIIFFCKEDESFEFDNELIYVIKIPKGFENETSWVYNKNINWPDHIPMGRYFVHIYSDKLSETMDVKKYHNRNNNLHDVIY